MKETRLELDQARLNQIIMELDILHKSHSPYIVDFYGAFFIESCVYYCMEYMDAGSLETLYYSGMPESVISTISHAVRQFNICPCSVLTESLGGQRTSISER
jgi:mitogen-activated protein kinase kinase